MRKLTDKIFDAILRFDWFCLVALALFAIVTMIHDYGSAWVNGRTAVCSFSFLELFLMLLVSVATMIFLWAYYYGRSFYFLK